MTSSTEFSTSSGRPSSPARPCTSTAVRPPAIETKGIPMFKPTIVLVHGAFGDASSWRAVFDLLDGGEYALLAAALPLRGVASDVAYLEAVIAQLDGPVILVGHSYAGCVITVAGASDNVAALVYVAGFVPEVGESIADLQGRFPSLAMGDFLQPRPLPD